MLWPVIFIQQFAPSNLLSKICIILLKIKFPLPVAGASKSSGMNCQRQII